MCFPCLPGVMSVQCEGCWMVYLSSTWNTPWGVSVWGVCGWGREGWLRLSLPFNVCGVRGVCTGGRATGSWWVAGRGGQKSFHVGRRAQGKLAQAGHGGRLA